MTPAKGLAGSPRRIDDVPRGLGERLSDVYARAFQGDRLVEEWIGREGELRRRRPEVARQLASARESGDADHAILYTGQTAGLIGDLRPAADVVATMVSEAEATIARLTALADG